MLKLKYFSFRYYDCEIRNIFNDIRMILFMGIFVLLGLKYVFSLFIG